MLAFITDFFNVHIFECNNSISGKVLRGHHSDRLKSFESLFFFLSLSLALYTNYLPSPVNCTSKMSLTSISYPIVTLEHLLFSHLIISFLTGLFNCYFPPHKFILCNHQIYVKKYSSNRFTVMFKNIQWFLIAVQSKNKHLFLASQAYPNMTSSLLSTYSPDKMGKM